jgi:hypothetical protein
MAKMVEGLSCSGNKEKAVVNAAAGFRVVFVLVLLFSGCFPAPAPPQAPPKAGTTAAATPSSALAEATPADAGKLTANQILERLLKTYRSAATYADQGVIRLEYKQAGQAYGDQWPCSVQFARPNKLSLAAYQATVKCNGRELVAKIADEATRDLDGQFLVRPAPQELKLIDLAADEILYGIIASELRRQPIQLELLLESGGLAAAFGADIACKRLDDGQALGRNCFRVEVPSPGGSYVFWIDQADLLLRRLDYPAAALLPGLANDPGVSDVRLSAELVDAKLGQPIDDREFTLALPAGAKRMRSLVRPVPPLPSELFGKSPGPLRFTKLDGGQLTSDDLAGKPAVLVWYHGDPACEATLQEVAKARQRVAAEDAAFYAVATDPTSASNDQIREQLAAWKVDVPAVRDLAALGDSLLKIKGHPTVIVLDGQSRVQIFQVGGNPNLADQLVQIVQRLKRGADLAAEIVAQHERDRKQYEELVAHGGPEPGQVFELPEAVIRKRSEPEKLKLKELWTCRELRSPGNILVVEEPNHAARLFVVEGWRTMTELGADGKVVARHALEIPEQALVTYARPARNKAGQSIFAAAAPLGPQVFLFDADWRPLRTFPAPDEAPLAVADLSWADVGNADGEPDLLVANVGEIGLAAVDTSGKALWRNRAFANATSVAVSRPDDTGSWGIFLTGEPGTVLRVNRYGHEETPQAVGNWPIGRLVAARFPGGKQARFLGLSATAQGEPFAVGITSELKEAWNYPLPKGAHQRPIDTVTSSNLLPGRQGEWWLAGPDGSIHVISEDGEFHDSFYYGAALAGLAATSLGEHNVLLVATEEGVAAWKIH